MKFTASLAKTTAALLCACTLTGCTSAASSTPSMISGTIIYSFPAATPSTVTSTAPSETSSVTSSKTSSTASSKTSSVASSKTSSTTSSKTSSVTSSAASSESAPATSSQTASYVTDPASYVPDPAYDWAAILVNKNSLLPDGYEPELGKLNSSRKFDARVLPYMKAMIADAKKDGITLNVISSYRAPSRQVELYNNKVKEYLNRGYSQKDAEEAAGQLVAPPGTSEHCTGLAADIVSTDWYDHHSSLTEDFDETPEYAWLEAHAAEYGFVLRYPKDKEDITMISYEPWHYRFVGHTAAAYIKANGLCLEEYVAQYYAE